MRALCTEYILYWMERYFPLDIYICYVLRFVYIVSLIKEHIVLNLELLQLPAPLAEEESMPLIFSSWKWITVMRRSSIRQC